jgi:hypothetical protein
MFFHYFTLLRMIIGYFCAGRIACRVEKETEAPENWKISLRGKGGSMWNIAFLREIGSLKTGSRER